MMKMIKKAISMLLALLLVMSLAACGGNTGADNQNASNDEDQSSSQNDGQSSDGAQQPDGSGEADSHYPVTITTYDYAKNPVELTFTEKPTRVISGQEIWNEMLLYFGLDEYIVGAAGSDSNVPEEFLERYEALPRLEDSWNNKEGIIALEPQVFFGWRSHFAEDSLGDIYDWMDRSIQPVVLNCANNAMGSPSVEGVLQDFDNLGKIFDIQDQTDAYISDAEAMLADIKDTVDNLGERKTVLMLEYYEGSTSVYAWGTISLSGQMITNAGGDNPISESGDISLEDIVSYDPDKIILMNAGNSDTEEDRQSIYNAFYALEGLQNVTAVKNQAVKIYPLDDVYGGGIRIIPAIRDIYQWIYEA